MAHNSISADTLISSSGTLASIGLALVGILAGKSALDKTETVADDLFLFSSLGFLLVLVLGYVSQKSEIEARTHRILDLAERCFTVSMALMVVAALVLVYAEV